MRILQAVTLVSPDGAYGGPVRVALNQLGALRSAGNDVRLLGATRGYRHPPTELDSVPLSLFPARRLIPRSGFVGLSAPGAVSWLLRHRRDIDVVHFHLARDLVMLPLAHLVMGLGIPYVVQAHGMIAPRAGRAGRLFDQLAVRRVLAGASTVLYLTDQERDGLQTVAGDRELPLVRLTNGVPLYPDTASDLDDERSPEVLFLARLQERKRPLDFVEAARRLVDSGVQARFTLVGPDEGEAAAVSAAIADYPQITWEGPVDTGAGPARVGRADVYVLPSVNEPYPMSVLEAMSVGRPVVITDECGLAEVVRANGCGIVVTPGAENVLAAMQTLLDDPAEAAAMGRRGRETVVRTFTMDAIASELLGLYTKAVGATV